MTLRELGARRQAACVGASRWTCTRQCCGDADVWQGDDSEAGDFRQFPNSPFSTCGPSWRLARNSANAHSVNLVGMVHCIQSVSFSDFDRFSLQVRLLFDGKCCCEFSRSPSPFQHLVSMSQALQVHVQHSASLLAHICTCTHNTGIHTRRSRILASLPYRIP